SATPLATSSAPSASAANSRRRTRLAPSPASPRRGWSPIPAARTRANTLAGVQLRPEVAPQRRPFIGVADMQHTRFVEGLAGDLQAEWQAAPGKSATHRHRRLAGDVERHHERALEGLEFRLFVDARRLARRDAGDQHVEIAHRLAHLIGELAAQAQSLNIVGTAEEGAKHDAVAHHPAVVAEALAHHLLVHRPGFGNEDEPAAGAV